MKLYAINGQGVIKQDGKMLTALDVLYLLQKYEAGPETTEYWAADFRQLKADRDTYLANWQDAKEELRKTELHSEARHERMVKAETDRDNLAYLGSVMTSELEAIAYCNDAGDPREMAKSCLEALAARTRP